MTRGPLPRFARAILQRSPGLHRQVYRLGSRYALPLLEWLAGFRTPDDDPLWWRWELTLGLFERDTAAVVRKLVRPGHVALDLGAHVGYYTRMLSRRAGPGGRVIAFEPHPRTFELLVANLRGANNVRLFRNAVGSSAGTATLIDALPETGGASLASREDRASWCATHVRGRAFAPRLEGDFVPRHFTVQTVTVDQVMAEAGIDRVDFVKIDIEGAEAAALAGMATTISRSRRMAMVMELNPDALRAFQCSPQELLANVRRYGFEVYTIARVPVAVTSAIEKQIIEELLCRQPGAQINLLCLRGYDGTGRMPSTTT